MSALKKPWRGTKIQRSKSMVRLWVRRSRTTNIQVSKKAARYMHACLIRRGLMAFHVGFTGDVGVLGLGLALVRLPRLALVPGVLVLVLILVLVELVLVGVGVLVGLVGDGVFDDVEDFSGLSFDWTGG